MSIVRKVLGRKSKGDSRSSMTVNDAVTIIQNYCCIMLHKSPASFYISDANKLPYPKDTIKQALVIALRANAKQQVMDVLKIGYLQLANWQEGVGESDLAIGAVDYAEDNAEAVRRVTLNFEEVDAWNAILIKERMLLKDDLITLGVW